MNRKTITLIGKKIGVIVLVFSLIILFVSCKQNDSDNIVEADSNQALQEQIEERTTEIEVAKENVSVTFGNVVSQNGNIYFWKYNSNSFSSDNAYFGDYRFNQDTVNELVCRNTDGEETTVLSANGEGEICIANDRIYYQAITSEYNAPSFNANDRNFHIKSCSLNGSDIKDHGDGVLLGVIDDGQYLIVKNTEWESYCIFSINTKSEEIAELSHDSYLICSDDAVICYRTNRDEGRTRLWFDESQTIYSVNGDGRSTKKLYTEQANSLQSVIDARDYATDFIDGYISLSAPYLVDNRLFYVYEHIAGTGSVTQSSHVTSIDLATNEEKDIPGTVLKDYGVYSQVEIEITDEATQAYQNYLSDINHLHVLNKEDYSSFCEAEISVAGDETGILKAEYSEHIGNQLYVFLTYGEFVKYDGWKQVYRFKKCALFEKDAETGFATMIYSSINPVAESDFLPADDEAFHLLEETFSNIKQISYHTDYDVETTNAEEVFSILIDPMGNMAGLSTRPEVTEIQSKADPLNKLTGVFPDSDYSIYYGYWFVSVDKLQQTADRVLGYKSEFPDELYWNYETEAIWAYRYGTDYCISIPAAIDGVYGTMTTKVNRYEPMSDGRYKVFCTVTTTLDGGYVDGVDDYSITAGFREIDGEKFWTIYAFCAI